MELDFIKILGLLFRRIIQKACQAHPVLYNFFKKVLRGLISFLLYFARFVGSEPVLINKVRSEQTDQLSVKLIKTGQRFRKLKR